MWVSVALTVAQTSVPGMRQTSAWIAAVMVAVIAAVALRTLRQHKPEATGQDDGGTAAIESAAPCSPEIETAMR